MRINIALDKEKKLGQQVVDAFKNELTKDDICFPIPPDYCEKSLRFKSRLLGSIRSQTQGHEMASFLDMRR